MRSYLAAGVVVISITGASCSLAAPPVLTPESADAVPHDWTAVQRLEARSRIRVDLRSGKSHSGELARATDQAVGIWSADDVRDVPRGDVVAVWLVRTQGAHRAKRCAGIGAVLGGSLMTVLTGGYFPFIAMGAVSYASLGAV